MSKKETDKKKKVEDSGEESGSEGFSFGGFFKGLGKLIDLADQLKKNGEFSQKKEFKIPTGQEGKDIHGVYGFTVRTLASGEPRVEPFGNIKKVQKIPGGVVVEEFREPIVDVFDEETEILIVAELPGIEKDEVQYELKGDIFKITTNHSKRKYSKEILLSSLVEPKPEHVSFKNGILEIKFKKAKKK